MLAVILKNTILVVLMICIGYFLIDNHLQEISNEMKYKTSEERPRTIVEQHSKRPYVEQIMQANEADPSPLEQTVEEVEQSELPSADNNSSRAMKITIDDNMKEIYDYVFSDVDAKESLDIMYDNQDVPKKEEMCMDNTEDTRYGKMCQDPIKDHHEKIDYKYIQVEPASNKPLIVEEIAAA